MNPAMLEKIAAKKAAAMTGEQAGDGLMMGVDMFAGRVHAFFEDQEAKTNHPVGSLSLLISQYVDEVAKNKQEVRFDLMRMIAENVPARYAHVSQHKAAEIIGLPEMFEFIVGKQLRKNILESFRIIAGKTGLPAMELQFHIEISEGHKHGLKLSIKHKGNFLEEFNPEEVIQSALEKGEFNTQNGNSNQ